MPTRPADSCLLGFSRLSTLSMHLPLAGAIERLGAITLHIALSLIVLLTFLHRNVLFYLLALLWHAAIDGVAVYLQGSGWDVWPIEELLLVIALINLGIILYLRRSTQTPSATAPMAEPRGEIEPAAEG
ncbi:MAG: YhfC family intramembrane metalloprotease [Chloroflexi bacterium]|nr:YhfC family intramembrane metalloprotease [Chloroflexota bacterium]